MLNSSILTSYKDKSVAEEKVEKTVSELLPENLSTPKSLSFSGLNFILSFDFSYFQRKERRKLLWILNHKLEI